MKVSSHIVLFCIVIIFTTMACDTKVSMYATVVIIPDQTYEILSNKVLLVSKVNSRKQTATVTVENSSLIRTQTVRGDLLAFFDTESEVKFFLKHFEPYLNTHVVSNAPMILRAHPNFDALKLAVVDSGEEIPIIHYMKTPESRVSITGKSLDAVITNSFAEQEVSSYLDNEGYWIQTQYYSTEDSHDYIRGWVFITEHMSIIFSDNNTTNASIIPRTFRGIRNWMSTDAMLHMSQGLDVPVQYDYTLILESLENSARPFITILHEDSPLNIHYSELWPINVNTAIIPYKDITLSWNIERKEISLRYPGDIQYVFVPATEPQAPLKREERVSYYYNYLSRSPLYRNSNTVVWHSNLYGKILFSAISGKYQVEMDWHITPEIASLYFPAGTNLVRGIVSFTHVRANNMVHDTDMVLTVYDVDRRSTFFLSLIEISDTEMSLQFMPEANILTDTKKESIITAPPVDPKMIFEK